LLFAKERGYDDLVGQLQRKWFEDIKCPDPLTRNAVLDSALGGDERLVDVRAGILRIDVLAAVVKGSDAAILAILQRGGRVDELRELLMIRDAAGEAVTAESGDIVNDEHRDYSFLRPFEMKNQYVWGYERHTVSKLLLCAENGRGRAHIALATEGYTELLRFCLSNVKGWTAAMEINVIRIASFYGHAAILEMLLNPDGAFTLHSDESDRRNAAILGAGEALRYRDLEVFANHGALTDPMMEKARIINKSLKRACLMNQIMMKKLIVSDK
jgi:hypothetical protein